MDAKLFVLLLALATQQSIYALSVDDDLKEMGASVANQTQVVTEYAADQNPNTLSEQEEISNIIGNHVKAFEAGFVNELKTLLTSIETERQNAGINSAKSLCLKLQETKIDPLQQTCHERAAALQATVDKQVKELVDTTRQVQHDTQVDMQVKTVVQLCMKIYPAIDQGTLRITCFDQFGSDLNITQKTKGETLLERVDGIQQQSMTISQKADKALRDMYAQNHLDLDALNKTMDMCNNLPGPGPEPLTSSTAAPPAPTPAPPAPTPAPPAPTPAPQTPAPAPPAPAPTPAPAPAPAPTPPKP